MKNKYYTLLTLFLISLISLSGQDIAFASKISKTGENNANTNSSKIEYFVPSINERLNSISSELAGNHLFGDEVAKQLYLFENTYTYKVPVSPGNPALKTIIQKPIIYSAVNKIEKILRKEVKSKKTDLNTATLKFEKVLEVAICIFNQDTKMLEDKISNTSDSSELINIFINDISLHFLN